MQKPFPFLAIIPVHLLPGTLLSTGQMNEAGLLQALKPIVRPKTR
jgi:hypothetical protein